MISKIPRILFHCLSEYTLHTREILRWSKNMSRFDSLKYAGIFFAHSKNMYVYPWEAPMYPLAIPTARSFLLMWMQYWKFNWPYKKKKSEEWGDYYFQVWSCYHEWIKMNLVLKWHEKNLSYLISKKYIL